MNELINNITILLKGKLPGLSTQQQMAPSIRYRGKYSPENNEAFRDSGVLLLVYPFNKNAHTVFMKRNIYNGAHSGQISLPGGKSEPADNNLIETAIREAEEEIGISRNQIQILGTLTPLFVPASGFRILPVIGYLAKKPIFIPDPGEVSELIEIGLETLFEPSNTKVEVLNIKGLSLTAPYFDVKGHHIWGATAMILSEFREIYRNALTLR
jgi:8-oxo-dGTP pyrophosphatase MutT (NUDIX family)